MKKNKNNVAAERSSANVCSRRSCSANAPRGFNPASSVIPNLIGNLSVSALPWRACSSLRLSAVLCGGSAGEAISNRCHSEAKPKNLVGIIFSLLFVAKSLCRGVYPVFYGVAASLRTRTVPILGGA